MSKRQEAQELERRALEFIRANVDLNAVDLDEATALFFATVVLPPEQWQVFFRFTANRVRFERAGSLTPVLDALGLEPEWFRETYLAVTDGALDDELAIRKERGNAIHV